MDNKEINSFETLALEIATLTRCNHTQSKIISYYRAHNYSIRRRNRMLVHCNRAYMLLVFILLMYILISVVVG